MGLFDGIRNLVVSQNSGPRYGPQNIIIFTYHGDLGGISNFGKPHFMLDADVCDSAAEMSSVAVPQVRRLITGTAGVIAVLQL